MKFCYNEFLLKSVPYMSKNTKIKESKQSVRETVQKNVKIVHDELLKESQIYLNHRF